MTANQGVALCRRGDVLVLLRQKNLSFWRGKVLFFEKTFLQKMDQFDHLRRERPLGA